MGYSPSAISQQLSALEREAGIALLERTAQSANLTDAGRELASLAGGILDSVEAAQSRMRARAGTISGTVTLSCIPGLAVVLAPHLAAVQREHPELTIVAHEIDSTEAETAVLDGRSDLAVVDSWAVGARLGSSGLDVHDLRREEVALTVPAAHPLSTRSTPMSETALRQVVQTDIWLCTPVGQLSRAAIDERLEAIGAEPQRRWEFEGLHVLAALVTADSGVALLPSGITDTQPGVVCLPLRPKMYRRILAVTRNTIRHDPAIEACLEAARQAFA
jgi:DNA-binding transcriptional LysR family regulator